MIDDRRILEIDRGDDGNNLFLVGLLGPLFLMWIANGLLTMRSVHRASALVPELPDARIARR